MKKTEKPVKGTDAVSETDDSEKKPTGSFLRDDTGKPVPVMKIDKAEKVSRKDSSLDGLIPYGPYKPALKKLNQVSSSQKAHTSLDDDGDDDENDDSSFGEKEDKKKFMAGEKAQSAKNQKKLADDEAFAKQDAEDTKKETKLNKFTGTYHNEDGTRQFKDQDKKGAAGDFVSGVNNWINIKKSKKVAAYSADEDTTSSQKPQHHKQPP